MITIDQVAIYSAPGKAPLYSSHGYLVNEKGECWALLHRHYHGVALALLYLEVFESYKAKSEDKDQLSLEEDSINVFAFQRFEMEASRELPIVRVCPTRMLGPASFSMSKTPCTFNQMLTLRMVVAGMGISQRGEVATDYGDMPLRDFLAKAVLPHDQRF